MKTCYLALSVLRRSWFPFLVACLIMTLSLSLLVSAAAEYRYITASRDALQADYLQNAVFFTLPYNSNDEPYLPDGLTDAPACKGLVLLSSGGLARTQSGEYYNTTVLSREAIGAVTLPMQSGRYLDPSADTPEAVVSDRYRGEIPLGGTLVLQDGTSAVVVGFVRGEMPLPSFRRFGTDMSADRLFDANTDSILLFLPGSAAKNAYRPVAAMLFDPSAAANDRLALAKQLGENGRTVPFSSLLEQTERTVDAALRQKLPLPLFLLVISTVAMLCVSALAIERSMREQSNYYLLGCSKRHSKGILLLAVCAVFTVPTVINLVLLYAFPDFLRFDTKAYMLTNHIVLLLLLYWGACMLFSAVLTHLLYGKYTPLAFYRKNLT
ncbi:MAG: hypothetical protein IJD82_06855 [Clostridia bacterium]|nr:hypothetical protein [Clostridia bacterium]